MCKIPHFLGGRAPTPHGASTSLAPQNEITSYAYEKGHHYKSFSSPITHAPPLTSGDIQSFVPTGVVIEWGLFFLDTVITILSCVVF